MLKLKKEKISESSIKIGDGNKFDGDTAIGQGAKIIKDSVVIDNSQNKSTTYKTKKKDVTILNQFSPYLIEKFGKKKIGIVGIISLIAGVITILSGIKSLLFSTNSNSFNVLFIEILPAAPQNFGVLIFMIGVILLILGLFLLQVLNYHNYTRCERCNKDFAYQEIGTPRTEETKTRWGYNEITTRTLQCRFCGHSTERDLIEEFDENGNKII